MLQELQDPTVETGVTNQLLEDVPPFQEHPFIQQARTFIKNGTHPYMYYEAVRESLPKVNGVQRKTAMHLLTDIEMALINRITQEFHAANTDRSDGNTKAVKPTDLYRKYAKVLRLIISRRRAITSLHAETLLQDLYLEQTLSEGDLHNPDYIDAYTGEIQVDEEQQFDVHECVDKVVRLNPHIDPRKLLKAAIDYREPDHSKTTAISQSHKETLKWAIQLKKELHWTDEIAEAFVTAQMDGYDADSDDIQLPDDDIDPYTPPTLIDNGLVLDRELWYSARPDVIAFNKARSAIFQKMQQDVLARRRWRKRFKEMKHKTHWRKFWYQKYWELRKIDRPHKTWQATFRKLITRSDAWTQVIFRIRDVAREDVVTAAALYVSLAGDYGLLENDVTDIRGLYELPEKYYKPEQIPPGAYVPLVNYANAWEDELLNLVQDALSPTSETNPYEFPDILMDTITVDENGDIEVKPAALRTTCPTFHSNPLQTAAWNLRFAQAATSRTTWKQAEDAAWAQWRREMSPEAADAYDKVFKETEDRRKAMQAFWDIAPKTVLRPKAKIKNIDKSKKGVNLEGGRFVTWSLLAMKIRLNEIDLGDEDALYIAGVRDQQKRLGLSPDCVTWLLQKAGIENHVPLRERFLAKLKQLNIGQPVWDLIAPKK